MKQNKGITIISLVITIIIMLILAGITLNLVIGKNGIIQNAKNAKEQTQIAGYIEKIEFIKNDLQLRNSNYEIASKEQIKEELDNQNNKNWVAETKYIIDNEQNKLMLTTRDGYIFYITETTTEYKGHGEISEEYIPLEVTTKKIDTSNLTRKTDIPLHDLFDIKWGSDGEGKIEYSIIGKLQFNNNNTPYNSETVNNISELELGTYTVTCKVTNSTNQMTRVDKIVKVTALDTTKVNNNRNQPVNAYAIYSAYDLAYFRDLVNNGQTSICGKIMQDIDLSSVCGETIGISWTPIGKVEGNWNSFVAYKGIFDGDNNTISNLYINSNNSGLGLFGALEDGTVKNMTVTGKIKSINAVSDVGGIISTCWTSNVNLKSVILKNLHNGVEIDTPTAVKVGGIVGNCGGVEIENCSNTVDISGNYYVGGIIGLNNNTKIVAGVSITRCYNTAGISGIGADSSSGSYVRRHRRSNVWNQYYNKPML